MNKITLQEVDIAINELGNAIKEAIALDCEKIKLAEKERLNRTRLLKARERVRDLRE